MLFANDIYDSCDEEEQDNEELEQYSASANHTPSTRYSQSWEKEEL